MRLRLVLLAAAVLLSGLPGLAAARPAREQGSQGGQRAARVLRLNHFQAKGTHNSYHRRPATPPSHTVIEDWDYEHSPLDVQLGQEGVRQLELDVHWNPVDQRFEVLHIRLFDENTTCRLLRTCLETVRAWSEANPGHHPVFFHIEPKDEEEPPPFKIDGHLDALDAEIRAVLGDRLVTPDSVQGNAPTLRDAILGRGWPRLADIRGRMVFLLHTRNYHRDTYTAGGTTLRGRAMFVEHDTEGEYGPLAGVMSINDPRSPRIREAVALGFIVRTMADDPAEVTAALENGAHMISTDYPAPGRRDDGFWVDIPGGTPLRCNPISAPARCTSRAIEDLG